MHLWAFMCGLRTWYKPLKILRVQVQQEVILPCHTHNWLVLWQISDKLWQKVWTMMGWNYKTHYCRHKRTSRRERLWKTSDYTHCFKSLVALHRFDWVCQIISLNYQIVRTKGLSWWSLKSNNFIVLLIEGFQLQSKLIYVYRRSPSQIIVKWSPSIFIATLLISMITSFLRS